MGKWREPAPTFLVKIEYAPLFDESDLAVPGLQLPTADQRPFELDIEIRKSVVKAARAYGAY